MKTTKNIARLAVTAGLTAALSFGGVVAPVGMAFVAGTPVATTSGNVTIEDGGYEGTTFKGIKIFSATVTQDQTSADVWDSTDEKTLSDITWASDDVKAAVMGAFTEGDGKPEGDNAQTWAEWINTKTAGEYAGVTDQTTKLNVGTTLDRIARALEGKTWTNPKNGTAGTFEGIAAGYWLFETQSVGKTNGADGSDDAYTSPIFTVVGGEGVKPEPKKSVPTVEKKILDDSKVKNDLKTVPEDDWKDAADSQIGQVVNYRLTGTVASNYATFDKYAYKFTDVLSNGLDYDDESVEVYALNGSTYTLIDKSNYYVTKPEASNKNTLTVEFKVDGTDNGLKDVKGVDDNTTIVVFYRAKLNANAVIAGANGELGGNPNTVTLTYSNNPMSGGTGTSAPDTVKDYTYGLRINKVDLGTEKALSGAKFTITTTGDEGKTTAKYVATNGTLSDDKVVHETGDDGSIRLTGLDAGTYTVTEEEAPNGYTAVSSFEFTIDPTINDEGHQGYKLTKLEGRLDSKGQNDKVIAGLTDEKSGDNKLTKKDKSEKNADGTFNITVGDTKQINLPLTGLNGVTFTWIAGGAVLCIGVTHLIRSRRRDEGSEE